MITKSKYKTKKKKEKSNKLTLWSNIFGWWSRQRSRRFREKSLHNPQNPLPHSPTHKKQNQINKPHRKTKTKIKAFEFLLDLWKVFQGLDGGFEAADASVGVGERHVEIFRNPVGPCHFLPLLQEVESDLLVLGAADRTHILHCAWNWNLGFLNRRKDWGLGLRIGCGERGGGGSL